MRVLTLKEELEIYKREAKENWDKYLRALAELDNFKKTMKKEMEEAIERANEKFIKNILPALDNFEAGIKMLEKMKSKDDEFLKGVKIIYKQLLDALEKEGLVQYSALGQKFDPKLHEAISVKETDDCEDDTIIEEIAKGYLFKGRVIRPAKVVVAKQKVKGEVKNG